MGELNNLNIRELALEDYQKGMKYKDIAQKYNVTLNTVKSWKTRYKWSKESVHTKEKVCTPKRGAPKGNKESVAKEVRSVLDNTELTDKQRLFCLYYIKCFNATKAYQKAYECDYRTAQSNGYKLLTNAYIIEEINSLKQGKLNQVMLEPSDIFQRYMDIAFADITDYLEFGREEIPVMGPFGPIVIKDEETGEKVSLTKMINVVKFKDSTQIDGTILSEVKQGKDGASIKLQDKMKALNWLSEHMNMATEEQKLKVQKLQLEINKINGDETDTVQDDSFIDALSGKVDDLWQEE